MPAALAGSRPSWPKITVFPARTIGLMTWDELLDYGRGKPAPWQDEPWEGDVVAKVGPKIFAFLGAGREGLSVGLKCGASREAADEWVIRFPGDASAMRYLG